MVSASRPVPIHRRADAVMTGMEQLTFAGSGGFSLQGYRLARPVADGPPSAVAIFVHGMAEHARRYAATAAELATVGVLSYSFDQRGHGPHALESGSLGFVAECDGFSLLVRDLVCVIDQLRADHPAVPLVLLGQSMGSLVVRDYLQRYGDHASRLHAVVLSGTVKHPGIAGRLALLYALALRTTRGARASAVELHRLTFGAYGRRFRPQRTPFDWLSREPSEVDAYAEDPLCGFVCSVGFYVDLLRAALRTNGKRAAAATPAVLPMLLISGAVDPVGGFGRGVRRAVARYRRHGVQRVTLRLFEDARHELYHETNGRQVLSGVKQWLLEEAL
ncbi:MAG: alpha/beta fold hydrolase [Spirochaetaceae bacterium]|nr:MAG: alpha/beta fold hydrolase [Spirochaetaceae bacterium]